MTKTQAKIDDVSFPLLLLEMFFLFIAFQKSAWCIQIPVHGIDLSLFRQGKQCFPNKHNQLLNIFIRIITYDKTNVASWPPPWVERSKTSSYGPRRNNLMKALDNLIFWFSYISTMASVHILAVGD